MATTPNLAPIQGFGGGAGSAHAATVVVNQDGSGDATTIAEAIALLPAAGGTIYLEGGTYTVPLTLTISIPVKIVGAGRVVATIDIAANLIAVFTISSQLVLEDLNVTSNGIAGQTGFDLLAGGSLRARNVRVSPIEKAFKGTNTLSVVTLYDCAIQTAALATGRTWERATGTLKLIRSDILGPGGNGGITDQPNLHLFDGSTVSLPNTTTFAISDAIFSDSLLSMGPIIVQGGDSSVMGCKFSGVGTRHLDLLAPIGFQPTIKVVGNEFRNATSEAIRTAAVGGSFTDNMGVCKIVETGGADRNYYANNDGFDGSTIIGSDSVVENRNTRTITTTPVTLNLNDRENLVDSSGGNRVVNLPTAASARYKVFTIKKVAAANTVTIDGSGAETIDGATTVVLTADDDVIVIISGGTAWFILSRFTPSILTDFISIPWERDLVSLPTLVQLTAIITRQLDNGITQGVLNTHLTPRDMNFAVNPIIRIQMYVNVAGTGTGNVRLRLTARYIAATELASKAADETLLITAPVATNTLEARQADVVFTLDSSLMADGDDVNLFLERLGADGADSFDGNIGIQTRGRLDFSKV